MIRRIVMAALTALLVGCGSGTSPSTAGAGSSPLAIGGPGAVDPVAAIRGALPSNWTIIAIRENADPYQPPTVKGTGRAIVLKVTTHAQPKGPDDAIVYVMPRDYSGAQPLYLAQRPWPVLIALTGRARIYLQGDIGPDWPTMDKDLAKALAK